MALACENAPFCAYIVFLRRMRLMMQRTLGQLPDALIPTVETRLRALFAL
ncbi:MAG: hypothetical protein KY445_08040 [Armatimonadetes bacterium]|nr:hypothetical protein [Armatimonadota bacterium]